MRRQNHAPMSSTIAAIAFDRIVKKLKKFTMNAAGSGTIERLFANWPTIATMIARCREQPQDSEQ